MKRPVRHTVRSRRDTGEGFAFSGAPILIFLLLVCIVVAVVRLRLKRSKKGAVRTKLKKDGIVESEHAGYDAPALQGVAIQAKVQRDWLRALRYLWASLLVELEASGLLRFDPAATNLELVRALHAQGRAVSLFGRIAGAFDLHFYGKVPVTEDDFTRVAAAASLMRKELGLHAVDDLNAKEKDHRVKRVLGGGAAS